MKIKPAHLAAFLAFIQWIQVLLYDYIENPPYSKIYEDVLGVVFIVVFIICWQMERNENGKV